ncbi:Ankyrin repeat domain-containing protein 44 [Parelaphostrongylus tenuis]|uniref:Ankyrin repeat domain-containing protein 44 n=1 Tax=Parelaphostrongylus tenuis TaxID=148309 RepID=A0AAD5M565_PARTN|nr:Ankyrin repeat domain-containing protein 44 [Parelaphostrongylus tenuis]
MISDVEDEVISAILTRNKSAVQSMILDGFDVSKSDSNGNSPLHYAAFAGDVAIASILIECGANINAQDSRGLTPLHRTIPSRNFAVAKLLIEKGCDVTLRCKLLQTPLHICAIHNVPSIASLLLSEKYPMLDSPDSCGCTALHHAAYRGHTEVAELLLKAGINMASVDNLNRTAMHSMACGGHIPILSMLIEGGASVTVTDCRGRNVAHFAAMGSHADLLGELLAIDATFAHITDIDGYSPLHYAVQNAQNSKTIELLLKSGCSINAAAHDGTTALHVSASLSESSVPLEYLIGCPAIDLNVKNADGMTPLHLASEWAKVSRVDSLLRGGSEVDPRSLNNATPLHCAALGGHELVVKHLIKSGADVNARMKGELTPLHLAAYNSSRPVCQTLLEMGADVEAKDVCLRTPLHLAANSIADSGAYTLDCLIEYKAGVNVADKYGFTPLHIAASRGLDNMVALLLKAGAEVDKPDLRGRNALHLAVLSHSTSIVEMLCYADEKCVYRQDCNGFYPLHYAAYNGDESLCSFLFIHMEWNMEYPTSGVHQGVTPIHLAAIRNMAKLLRRLADIQKKTEAMTGRKAALDRPLFTCTDVKGRIPLHYAMKYGHADSMVVLLSQPGAEVCLSWRDKDDLTPLHFAAANGKNNCFESVLEKFPEIGMNRKDSRGRTCGMLSLTALSGACWPLVIKSNLRQRDNLGRGYLHRAAYLRNQGILLKILEKCDPNTRDINGVTPLHIAAAVGEHDTVAALLEFGANPLVKDNRGFTPVDWAAAYNQLSSLQQFLPNSRQLSPDSAFGSGNMASSFSNASEETASKDLLSTSPSKRFDDAEFFGRAGLLFAAYFGNLSCVMYLIEMDPRLISARDPVGRTALHLAAWRGHCDCVEYLIDKGCEIEAVDECSATALIYSVRESKSSCVLEFLLQCGADVFIGDKDGNTVLHHSCLSKNEDAGKVLTRYLSQFDPERKLCNAVNGDGETALHIAVRNGLIEFLLCFIPYGSESMWIKDSRGRIPLLCGIEDQDITDCMQLLLACMAESPAEISSLLLPNPRRSRPSSVRKSSTEEQDGEFF